MFRVYHPSAAAEIGTLPDSIIYGLGDDILDLDQDGDARRIRILRLDQLGEREPGVLAEDIGDRGILKRVVQAKPVTAQVGLDVDVETPRDSN